MELREEVRDALREARARARGDARDFADMLAEARMDQDLDGTEAYSRGWVAACRAMVAYLEATP